MSSERRALRDRIADLRRSSGPSRATGSAGQRGYNLIELLMAMALSSVVFMSITTLYAYQAESFASQTHVLTSTRNGRFAMEHLRRDLMALGSNATPNSAIDDLVCPKPATVLRALTLDLNDGYVFRPDLNPHLRTVSITLFGSLDVKSRYETESISAKIVKLVDDGTLPSTEALWNDTFTTDRFLRMAAGDGKSMIIPIASTSFSDKTVTLTVEPDQMQGTQRCGYQGTGGGLTVDVQGLVRYRIIGDMRPTAPIDPNGNPVNTLLVRERLEVDGVTVHGALPLAENVVEIGVFDGYFDSDVAPDAIAKDERINVEEMVQADGSGVLGKTNAARPESLRAITVKLSIRADEQQRGLTHRPRADKRNPLMTYRMDPLGNGAAPVTTLATRVTMTTLISRNL